MRFLSIIGIVFLVALEFSEAARQATCETKTVQWWWNGRGQDLTTCSPKVYKVAEENFVIAKTAGDSDSLGFSIKSKSGVEFLPTNLYDVMPSLVAVQVLNCSVKVVNGKHFKGLIYLKSLSLAQNKIDHVASDAFVDLVNLEDLTLSGNKIQSLAENTFATLAQLKELRLDNNEITALASNIFHSLVSATLINIDFNNIVELDENIFENQALLKQIFIQHNKVIVIPPNLLKNNLKVEYVWFSNNSINIIDPSTFANRTNLRYVDLRFNKCVDEYYQLEQFGTMIEYLGRNCTGKLVEEMTTTTETSNNCNGKQNKSE